MSSLARFIPLHGLLHRNLSPVQTSLEHLSLQAAHRLGAISLLATLASWALVYEGQDFRWSLAIAFAAADLGFCTAWFSRILAQRLRHHTREATGAMIFNLLFLLLSLQLALLARLDVIRAAAGRFFSPS